MSSIAIGVTFQTAQRLSAAGVTASKVESAEKQTPSSDTAPVNAASSGWTWKCTAESVALLHGKTVIWQFNHGGELDVPYFHKLGLMDGVAMKPARCGGLTWSPWPE